MKYIVDRIGKEMVICEAENGDRVKLKEAQLPEGAREGDILSEKAGVWKLEREETDQRRQKMHEKLRRLIK